MVHAHWLPGRPPGRGVHPFREPLPGRESLSLGHQAAKLPEDRLGLGRVAQPETAHQERPVLGDERAQRAAVLGRPARRVAGRVDPQHRRLAGLQVHVQQ